METFTYAGPSLKCRADEAVPEFLSVCFACLDIVIVAVDQLLFVLSRLCFLF